MFFLLFFFKFRIFCWFFFFVLQFWVFAKLQHVLSMSACFLCFHFWYLFLCFLGCGWVDTIGGILIKLVLANINNKQYFTKKKHWQTKKECVHATCQIAQIRNALLADYAGFHGNATKKQQQAFSRKGRETNCQKFGCWFLKESKYLNTLP